MKKITYIILAMIFVLPAVNSCVDPVGIDNNIIKNRLTFDTTIIADTILLRDSIYFIIVDTVFSTKDSIIYKKDTMFVPLARNNYYKIHKYQILCNETTIRNGSDYFHLTWSRFTGNVSLEVDTSFTTGNVQKYV